MNTKVYYGEYNLRHWLNLMLTKNIDLPAYQRSFVWDEDDVKRMISSLKTGQFIPPVTIAHYKDIDSSSNLILDGQQRLTSILLAYLGYMPIREKFKESDDNMAMGDDSDEEGSVSTIEWTYKFLLDEKPSENNLISIEKRISIDKRYKNINVSFSSSKDDFYDNTFLGFSFVIPNSEDSGETQRYFSTLFRNMNYLGRKLSPLESRRSLYHLNVDFKDFFDGKLNNKDVLCDIRINENMKAKKIDFVRYLSTLSQYVGTRDIGKVLRGYSSYSSREGYYADFVSYIVGLEQESRKDKFDSFKIKTIFPNNEWRDRFLIVKDFLERNKSRLGLEKNDAFTSWIDADYWLYGLLYRVLFKGLTIENEDDLIEKVGREIKVKRENKDDEYVRNPNRIGNLRDRIIKSISLFGCDE